MYSDANSNIEILTIIYIYIYMYSTMYGATNKCIIVLREWKMILHPFITNPLNRYNHEYICIYFRCTQQWVVMYADKNTYVMCF